jgi:hypothetical protein
MMRTLALAIIVSLGCAACARLSVREAGYYDRTRYEYRNDQAGLRMTLPPPWLVRTKQDRFTVPLALRPDQEQILEAYHDAANLGLVVVVQTGPVAEIPELLQRMQAIPETRRHDQRPEVSTQDIQERFLGKVSINGRDAVAWIYTVAETADGQSTATTVIFYILKIQEHYVYLTFSTPAETYVDAQPVVESVLRTVTPSFDHT